MNGYTKLMFGEVCVSIHVCTYTCMFMDISVDVYGCMVGMLLVLNSNKAYISPPPTSN